MKCVTYKTIMNPRCIIILLAAGVSSRLGLPKQALPYKDSTLLTNSIRVALESIADKVIVILGTNALPVTITDKEKLQLLINEGWEEGMASSIRCGLQFANRRFPSAETALFMVCDQPFINTALLNNLITLQQQTGSAIVASTYNGVTGIPAIFKKQLFAELLTLQGDAGAKKIIAQQQEHVVTVPFPLGEIDIDTAADYSRLQKMQELLCR